MASGNTSVKGEFSEHSQHALLHNSDVDVIPVENAGNGANEMCSISKPYYIDGSSEEEYNFTDSTMPATPATPASPVTPTTSASTSTAVCFYNNDYEKIEAITQVIKKTKVMNEQKEFLNALPLPLGTGTKFETMDEISERHRIELREISIRMEQEFRWAKLLLRVPTHPISADKFSLSKCRLLPTMLCPFPYCLGTFSNANQHLEQMHKELTKEDAELYIQQVEKQKKEQIKSSMGRTEVNRKYERMTQCYCKGVEQFENSPLKGLRSKSEEVELLSAKPSKKVKPLLMCPRCEHVVYYPMQHVKSVHHDLKQKEMEKLRQAILANKCDDKGNAVPKNTSTNMRESSPSTKKDKFSTEPQAVRSLMQNFRKHMHSIYEPYRIIKRMLTQAIPDTGPDFLFTEIRSRINTNNIDALIPKVGCEGPIKFKIVDALIKFVDFSLLHTDLTSELGVAIVDLHSLKTLLIATQQNYLGEHCPENTALESITTQKEEIWVREITLKKVFKYSEITRVRLILLDALSLKISGIKSYGGIQNVLRLQDILITALTLNTCRSIQESLYLTLREFDAQTEMWSKGSCVIVGRTHETESGGEDAVFILEEIVVKAALKFRWCFRGEICKYTPEAPLFSTIAGHRLDVEVGCECLSRGWTAAYPKDVAGITAQLVSQAVASKVGLMRPHLAEKLSTLLFEDGIRPPLAEVIQVFEEMHRLVNDSPMSSGPGSSTHSCLSNRRNDTTLPSLPRNEILPMTEEVKVGSAASFSNSALRISITVAPASSNDTTLAQPPPPPKKKKKTKKRAKKPKKASHSSLAPGQPRRLSTSSATTSSATTSSATSSLSRPSHETEPSTRSRKASIHHLTDDDWRYFEECVVNYFLHGKSLGNKFVHSRKNLMASLPPIFENMNRKELMAEARLVRRQYKSVYGSDSI